MFKDFKIISLIPYKSKLEGLKKNLKKNQGLKVF